MLTIFTIPKPFKDDIKTIQRNAIGSWVKLHPTCEIILFGDEDGVAETADLFNLKHVSEIVRNEYGTPLLHNVFNGAQEVAKYDTLMFCNADMIFTDDLIGAINNLPKTEFLACGRRWDANITEEIDYSDAHWMDKILKLKKSSGILHGFAGLDYFIFKKKTIDMRPFAIGRPGWDNWLIYDVRSRGIPVIDTTAVITAIHQNHDYSHSKFGEKKRVGGPEYDGNIKIAGGLTNMLSLRDADWVLTKDGLNRPSFPRRTYSLLSLWYPWRLLLATKRKLQKLSGR
jgi:hypothetical protein